ncbi:hypothetical protein Tsubulata_020775 [Turnera subulata]|uniref:F-box domain-containing protein n=1 Tax=Turnera subulata TaxID=218843 RepID=A0A9Q0EZ14_9ROSI|nr:hypothetical protein Tsubulata_020775 [Turnera subulata]
MVVSGLRRKLLACFNSKADVASALPLPDDVIIDILSRLPADHVLQCRKVCKRWRALTSTAYFAQLQLQRATPVVLAGCLDSENPHCIYVNHAQQGLLRRNPPQEIAELNCFVLNSCDGLILGKRKTPSQLFYLQSNHSG